MKETKLFIGVIFMISSFFLTAQVSVSTDGNDPDSSVMLDVKSNNKGFLPPRVANVSSVSSPVAGLMVYDQSLNCMRYYNGTAWSECMGKSFFCENPFVDYRDGKVYNSVQIGPQCWMAENLNIGTMIDGSSIQTNNDTIEKYCYDNNTTNCNTYGGLYLWDEAMQYITTPRTQGVCPTGWHLPTDAEWQTMEMFLGMTQGQAEATGWRGTDEGGKLKETKTTHWTSPNTGATNTSGFTGLPGGYRTAYGTFWGPTQYDATTFWSSSENDSTAWLRHLHYKHVKVLRNVLSKANGYSIRCVLD